MVVTVGDLLFWYLAIGALVTMHRLAMIRMFGMLEHMLYHGPDDTNLQHRWAKLTAFVVMGALVWPFWSMRND